MSSSQIRTSELDNWSVVTHVCPNLDVAELLAQELLPRTHHVVLWPMKHDTWMVIAQFPVMLN